MLEQAGDSLQVLLTQEIDAHSELRQRCYSPTTVCPGLIIPFHKPSHTRLLKSP